MAKKPKFKSFAESLRYHREAAGLSIPELAEKSGCPRQYLHALEKGEKASPSFKIVFNLAKALDVLLDDFSPD